MPKSKSKSKLVSYFSVLHNSAKFGSQYTNKTLYQVECYNELVWARCMPA